MEETILKKNTDGPNVGRWREWRGINQDVLADQICVSQIVISNYEKRDKLKKDILDKIAKALSIPVKVITQLGQETTIIISSTFHDTSAVNYHTFNSVEKIVDLYDENGFI